MVYKWCIFVGDLVVFEFLDAETILYILFQVDILSRLLNRTEKEYSKCSPQGM